jgi:uncharacterized protein (DUF58 family)
MKEIDMKMTGSRTFRGVTWLSKAALSCLGLLAMLALIVVIVVLTPVMLAATVFAVTTPRPKRSLRGRRHGRTTLELPVPRKAVASHGRQVR